MDYKKYNDYELIYMVRENDDSSKSILFKKYHPILVSITNEYYYKYKQYGYDYDDFLQEAYIAFFNSLINFNENKNVLLYSYVIMCVRRKMMTFCKSISKNCKNISYNDYDEFIDILDARTDVYSMVNNFESEKMLRNAILDLSNAYAILAEKRKEANDASKESAESSLEAAKKAVEEKEENVEKIVAESVNRSINFKELTGTAKDKWQQVKNTQDIWGWADAAELGGGKGNHLRGVMQIANENLLSDTPGLKQLYDLMAADNSTALQQLIQTPEKRTAVFKQWNQELESITDPASKAAIDFVLYQLQNVSTELTSAFGELNAATAQQTAVIHSNAADYVNNFLADMRIMAEYGPKGKDKEQAKETLKMFKNIDNSSEILLKCFYLMVIKLGMNL